MLLLLFSQPSTVVANTSPNVNWWSATNEQTLIQELMTEAIEFYGMEVLYLPASLRREDTLYKEDILRQFATTYPITVYINDFMGWRGTGDFMSKFGIRVQDKLSVKVSKAAFADVFANSDIIRPTEGDLVYFPAPIDALFEIKFTEHEKGGGGGQFYPLGILTYYELELELHTFNQEDFATGNTIIDQIEVDQGFSQVLHMANTSGSGTYIPGETVYQGASVATATATGIVGEYADRVLKLTYNTGVFANGVAVRGATSNALYTLGELNTLVLPNSDNSYLDTESLDLIDTRDTV